MTVTGTLGGVIFGVRGMADHLWSARLARRAGV
jgi:hypothetical protein